MIVHIINARQNGHVKINIRTVDTVVIILGNLSSLITQFPNNKIVIAFGVGKSFLLFNAISMFHMQRTSIFHALTGCDSTSSFHHRGKKNSWKAWRSFPEIIQFNTFRCNCCRIVTFQISWMACNPVRQNIYNWVSEWTNEESCSVKEIAAWNQPTKDALIQHGKLEFGLQHVR